MCCLSGPVRSKLVNSSAKPTRFSTTTIQSELLAPSVRQETAPRSHHAPHPRTAVRHSQSHHHQRARYEHAHEHAHEHAQSGRVNVATNPSSGLVVARADVLNRQVQSNNNSKPFVQLSMSLPRLTTFPFANGSTGSPYHHYQASYSNTPFSISSNG